MSTSTGGSLDATGRQTLLRPGRRGDTALAVAAAVDRVEGAARSAGPGISIATQYPGGRVTGVRLGEEVVVVHVIAARLPLDRLADDVRRAAASVLSALGDQRSVDVVIEDLDVESLAGGARR